LIHHHVKLAFSNPVVHDRVAYAQPKRVVDGKPALK
jgi:hypothetical protein